MNRLPKAKRASRDEATLRAWEEMRLEILHEIEDGGDVPGELVDAAGDLAALDSPWSLSKPSIIRKSRIHAG